ncbi:MAG: sugar phosphate nucleotidyltransferase [Akkermansia muciniphila]
MHITAGLRISRAFILGAGLGTRLRPLTDILPKPLIPFFHEPLILHSMRRCYDCGIREFIINTHHLAAAWDKVFPEHSWNGCPVHFSHEPVLLDSGGGVKKIEPLASAEEPLLVVNGDMAATFDLGRLLEEHLSRRPPVTLALRTSGDKKNVGFDFSSGLVTDMRHALGRDPGSYQFTGAYCMEPEIFRRIPSGKPFPLFPVSGLHPGRTPARHSGGRRVVDGHGNTGPIFKPIWISHPRSASTPGPECPPRLCGGHCVIGPGAAVEDGCRLQGCVVWPGVCVPSGTCAERRIFYCSPTDY